VKVVRCSTLVNLLMMNVRKSMLTYCKTVIRKVSFCEKLTAKEYEKALSYLSTSEREQFREWFTNKSFGKKARIA